MRADPLSGGRRGWGGGECPSRGPRAQGQIPAIPILQRLPGPGRGKCCQWETVAPVSVGLADRQARAGGRTLLEVRATGHPREWQPDGACVHMASTQSTLPVHWYPDWTTRPRRR